MSFDPTQIVTFYGQEVVADYDNKVRLAVSGLGYDLPTVQERLWAENGFRDARLVQSIYGWTVRSGSGLDNWRFLAGRGLKWTFEQALEAAKAWQAEAPTQRFVWAYKSDLPTGE